MAANEAVTLTFGFMLAVSALSRVAAGVWAAARTAACRVLLAAVTAAGDRNARDTSCIAATGITPPVGKEEVGKAALIAAVIDADVATRCEAAAEATRLVAGANSLASREVSTGWSAGAVGKATISEGCDGACVDESASGVDVVSGCISTLAVKILASVVNFVLSTAAGNSVATGYRHHIQKLYVCVCAL